VRKHRGWLAEAATFSAVWSAPPRLSIDGTPFHPRRCPFDSLSAAGRTVWNDGSPGQWRNSNWKTPWDEGCQEEPQRPKQEGYLTLFSR